MQQAAPLDRGLHRRLVDSLYLEAMVMADEARSYFDGSMIGEDLVDPLRRVAFACESLKVTTRLMQVIAWLLGRRALLRGEIDVEEAHSERFRLGDAASSDVRFTRTLPAEMRLLIATSESLYHRARRLEEQMIDGAQGAVLHGHGPARALMQRLETAF